MRTRELVIISSMIICFFGWIAWQYCDPNKVTPAEATFGILIEVVGIGFTILVLDRIRYSEEQKRSKNVREIIKKYISRQYIDIYGYISQSLFPGHSIPLEIAGDFNRTFQYVETKRYEEMNKLAQSNPEEIEKIFQDDTIFNLFFAHMVFFDRIHMTLDELEIKYTRYLEHEELDLIMNIQQLLSQLTSTVRLIKDEKIKLNGEIKIYIAKTAFEIVKKLSETEYIKQKYKETESS